MGTLYIVDIESIKCMHCYVLHIAFQWLPDIKKQWSVFGADL